MFYDSFTFFTSLNVNVKQTEIQYQLPLWRMLHILTKQNVYFLRFFERKIGFTRWHKYKYYFAYNLCCDISVNTINIKYKNKYKYKRLYAMHTVCKVKVFKIRNKLVGQRFVCSISPIVITFSDRINSTIHCRKKVKLGTTRLSIPYFKCLSKRLHSNSMYGNK